MEIRSVPKNPGKRRTGKLRLHFPATPTEAATNTATDAPTESRGRLRVEPARVRAEADQLGALAPQIGGALAGLTGAQQDTEAERYVLQVDPIAPLVGQLVRNDLLRYDEVVAAAAVTTTAHQALQEQHAAAGEAYANAAERAEDIDDGLRAVGQDNRQLRRALAVVVPQVLSEAALPQAELVALRSAWTVLQTEESRQQQKVQSGRAETTTQNRRARETLEQSLRRERLMQTMLDLQAGTPVEPARAAEAVKAYDELLAEQAAAQSKAITAPPDDRGDRRGRGR